jgi:hypothetical protein
MGEQIITNGSYSDDMRRTASTDLHVVAAEQGIDLFILAMRDTDYYALFADGLPTYRRGHPAPITTYSLVHIDGEHTANAVHVALEFFVPRVVTGGIIVLDDVDQFDYLALAEQYLQGFRRSDAPLNDNRPHPIKVGYVKKG